MARTFKLGNQVEWDSEGGRVRGVIVKKVASDVRFKGYVHHASKEEPQYIIKSDKTNHIAIHKGRALKLTSEISATSSMRAPSRTLRSKPRDSAQAHFTTH